MMKVAPEHLVGGRVTLYGGDCLEVLEQLAPDTFHAVICDPPYHFGSIIKRWSKTGGGDRAQSKVGAFARHSNGFMGCSWDGGDIAFRPETWAKVLRVLKPGAHLVAFGAPKNMHRLVCAIEDAGFEIRDQILWLFGTGFPKSHDAKKAMGKSDDVDMFRQPLEHAAGKFEGWGSALKPAYEPIILARKPLAGTIQECLREHSTGGLNIDACRIHGSDVAYEREDEATQDKRYTDDGSTNFAAKPGRRYTVKRRKPGAEMARTGGNYRPEDRDTVYEGELKPGRFPANLCHDGSDDVVGLFPAQAGAQAPVHTRNGDKFRNAYGDFKGNIDEGGSTFQGDSGSAARFFYCPKATKEDRAGSKHPTVKPIALIRWLVRLIVPPDGLVLDCFAGTGTTAEAVHAEGGRTVLIEAHPTYQADIRTRLSRIVTDGAPQMGAVTEPAPELGVAIGAGHLLPLEVAE